MMIDGYYVHKAHGNKAAPHMLNPETTNKKPPQSIIPNGSRHVVGSHNAHLTNSLEVLIVRRKFDSHSNKINYLAVVKIETFIEIYLGGLYKF